MECAILDDDSDFEDNANDECTPVSSTPQQSVVSDSAAEKSPAVEIAGVEFGPFDSAAEKSPAVETAGVEFSPSDSAAEKPPAVETAGVEFGPYVRFSRLYEQTNYKEELQTIRSTKVICSLDLLLEQFMGKCPSPGCLLTRNMDYSVFGTCAIVRWQCPSGHKGKFSSSREINGLWANNLQTAAAVLFSGNNHAKVARFAEFLGLSFISNSTFHRMQRLYCLSAVDEWWEWMRRELIQEFTGERLALCGDGQCDSPGFSAKNLCYFIMEMVSEYILEVEVVDKRHVDMKSTAMEKKALEKALTRLKQALDVSEISTDASTTIKKLLGEL